MEQFLIKILTLIIFFFIQLIQHLNVYNLTCNNLQQTRRIHATGK
jgi:hypothetical protein